MERLVRGLVWLGVLTLPTWGQAQPTGGTIRGRVTETGGTAPLAAVQVVVTGTRQGAITDQDGRFLVRGVEPVITSSVAISVLP